MDDKSRPAAKGGRNGKPAAPTVGSAAVSTALNLETPDPQTAAPDPTPEPEPVEEAPAAPEQPAQTPPPPPAEGLPPGTDPNKVGQTTMRAVNALCEQTALEIEALAADMMKGAKEQEAMLLGLANAIRTHGTKAHERLQEFLTTQASVIETARALQDSIRAVGLTAMQPEHHEQ